MENQIVFEWRENENNNYHLFYKNFMVGSCFKKENGYLAISYLLNTKENNGIHELEIAKEIVMKIITKRIYSNNPKPFWPTGNW